LKKACAGSLVLLLAVWASPAHAQLSRIILLDMNGERGTTASVLNGNPHTWNTFPANHWEMANLVRADGSASGVSITAQTDVYRSMAADGDYWPNWMPQQASLGRLGQINNALVDAIKGGASTNAAFLIRGLNINSTYNLRLIGTKQAGFQKETRYIVASGSGRLTINEITLQTSGTNANASDPRLDANLNFNAVNLAVFRNLVPSPLDGGSLHLDVRAAPGSDEFILNALELEEVYSSYSPPLYLVDFGGGGFGADQTQQGRVATASPDGSGNYWNNSVGGDYGQPTDVSGLTSQFGEPSGISLTWFERGAGVAAANMGVSNVPAGSSLAGSPLNRPSAVADSVYTVSSETNNQLRISGLNPTKTYRLSLLASWASSEPHFTDFEIYGPNLAIPAATNRVQISGADLSGPGLDYNSTPWTFDVLPDANGELWVEYRVGSGGRACLNALSIQDVTDGSPPPPPPTTNLPVYLVDFGGAGVTNQPSYGAVPTTSPDLNGNHWNNSQGGPFGQPSNINGLVDRTNLASGISLTWTAWGSGVATSSMGITNIPGASGLSGSLLNVDTARNDSIFTSSTVTNNSLYLAGLDTNVVYQLSLFASRTATNSRTTAFQVSGRTTEANVVQTSGADLAGPGLNYSVTPWVLQMAPAANGRITIDYRAASGGFAYLNALAIQATTNSLPPLPPPNPGLEPYLVDFGGIGNTDQTGIGLVPTPSPDSNGNYWNNSAGGNFGQPANLSGLVDRLNRTSSISLTWSDWGSGVGSANSGVANVPAASALAGSPLNVTSAVADSVFTQNRTNFSSLVLRGLDPGIFYQLKIVASRAHTNARYTDFEITGATTLTNRIQTSGTDLSGAGLNFNSRLLDVSVAPSIWGELEVKFRVADIGENFAYLNALSLLPTTNPSGNPTNAVPLLTTAFQRWAYQRGWTNTTNALPGADPDGNGMNNLLEYGFAAGSQGSSGSELRPFAGETNGYLTLTYRKRTNDASLSVRAEWATNFTSGWWPEAGTNGPVLVASNPLAGEEGAAVTVRAPVLKSSAPKGFLRVGVSQRALVVGSSVMAYWTNIQTDLAPVPVLNRGVAGSQIQQWLSGAPQGHWESRVISQDNPLLIYYLGSNDISVGDSADNAFSETSQFLTAFRNLYPQAKILYLTTIRSPLRASEGKVAVVDSYNAKVQAYLTTLPRTRFVDVNQVLVNAAGAPLQAGLFQSDNNHLTLLGYEKMTEVVQPALYDLWYSASP
jgi:lysophospholipase L1-like esterase